MNKLITTTPKAKIADNFCGQCGNDLAGADNFCRNCGSPCHELSLVDESIPVQVVARRMHCPETAVAANETGQQVANTMETILNNRFYVFGIIALIGPLGLPAIWFSPCFSRKTKTITTVIFVLMTTVVPLVVAWYFLDYSLRPLVDAFGR